MKVITTPSELRSSFRMEVLEPFGLSITSRDRGDVTRLGGTLLSGILRSEKLLLMRGFAPLERDELLAFCQSYPDAELLHWDTGPVMEMKVSASPRNYLFSAEKVPFHWDGAFHKVPSYLVFHCIQAPPADAGGETLFTDTQGIWETAGDEERALWKRAELTYETEKLAHYGGKITVPMVQKHPRTGRTILRFAEAVETDLNPVSLSVGGVPRPEALVASMTEKIYSAEHCYRHRWQEGDYLIADNHALIHGRNAFTRDCPRHLRRIQIL